MTKASKEQLQTICLFLFINKIKNIKKNKKTKQNKTEKKPHKNKQNVKSEQNKHLVMSNINNTKIYETCEYVTVLSF